MDITNIIYYTRDEATGKSSTISLRELCLREEHSLEDIFRAVKDANDELDLLMRLQRLVLDKLCLDTSSASYIRIVVVDVNGQTNYLKFRKRR
jgi:hypothetical protein